MDNEKEDFDFQVELFIRHSKASNFFIKKLRKQKRKEAKLPDFNELYWCLQSAKSFVTYFALPSYWEPSLIKFFETNKLIRPDKTKFENLGIYIKDPYTFPRLVIEISKSTTKKDLINAWPTIKKLKKYSKDINLKNHKVYVTHDDIKAFKLSQKLGKTRGKWKIISDQLGLDSEYWRKRIRIQADRKSTRLNSSH